MAVPTTKATTYSQPDSGTLPTLDPIKQEVATPYTASNSTGEAAAQSIRGDSTDASAVSGSEYSALIKGSALSSRNVDVPDTGESTVDDTVTLNDDSTDEGFISEDTKKKLLATGKTYKRKLLGSSGSASWRTVGTMVKTDGSGAAVDWDKVKSRISGVATGNSGNNLTAQVQGAIKAAATLTGNEKVGITVGSFIGSVSSANYTSAQGIASMVKDIINGGALNDFPAVKAIVTGVSSTLFDLGIPTLIDLVIAKIEDIKRRNALYESQCIQAASAGNPYLVQHYIDLMGTSRSAKISDKIIRYLLANYKAGANDKTESYWGSALIEMFNSIDSGWLYNDKHSKLIDLKYLTYCNKAALHALQYTDIAFRAQAATHLTRTIPPATLISKYFPDAAI